MEEQGKTRDRQLLITMGLVGLVVLALGVGFVAGYVTGGSRATPAPPRAAMPATPMAASAPLGLTAAPAGTVAGGKPVPGAATSPTGVLPAGAAAAATGTMAGHPPG